MSVIDDLLRSQLDNLINTPCWVVAYSGGVDSHVLLQALLQLRSKLQSEAGKQPTHSVPQLRALHINHGLHPEASEWVQHCQSVCASLGVEFTAIEVEVERSQASLEQVARAARYQVFEANLQSGEILLQAHHQDDQAETLLLRLLRGAGVKGAVGIPTERPLGSGRIVRPLLDASQADIMQYAAAHDLSWVEDDSNSDLSFDRNFLRHKVMPLLAERWPQAAQALTRFTKINKDTKEVLDYFVQDALESIKAADNSKCLSIADLEAYPQPMQFELLRAWLEAQGFASPEFKRCQQILEEVIAAPGDAQPQLCWANVEIRRFQGRLYALTQQTEFDAELREVWPANQACLTIANLGELSREQSEGAGIANEYLSANWEVRLRQGGERIQPVGRHETHQLKSLLQSSGIPPWQRERLPLIYIEGRLAAVADLWVSQEFAAKPGQLGHKIRWSPV